MDINITKLVNVDMWPVSGSIATHGTNAATDTFEAAKSANTNCLDTPEKLKAYRNHLKRSGMEDTELLTSAELNAILLQEVSISLRENDLECLEDVKEYDPWEGYIPIFFGTDKEFYFATSD